MKKEGRKKEAKQASKVYMLASRSFFLPSHLSLKHLSDYFVCAVLFCLVICLTLLASFFLPSHLSLKHLSDYLGCAVLFCLIVCLTLLASFFLPSHLSLKHVYNVYYMYIYVHVPLRAQ